MTSDSRHSNNFEGKNIQTRVAVPNRLSFASRAVFRTSIRGGRVGQGNFDHYPMLLLGDMPKVEVYPVPSGIAAIRAQNR